MAGDYTIENIYEPGYSSFIPGKDSPYLGKQNLVSTKNMGMTTDPRTANQLGEISRNLNTGVINIEMGTMDMPTFDTIPKQHLEEIRRKDREINDKQEMERIISKAEVYLGMI